LSVFWLLRCSDWLQGPYFYEVYASKVVNGVSASLSLVSRLFLTGFASTALFGPMVGRAADQYGRKKATLAFTVLYALGALSTKSMALRLLLLGRVASGIGTSLLFSAPESWLVAEAQNSGDDPDGTYLGETFAWAYAGDSIVAIAAGQMAATTAAQRGPTGPFELSTLFLGVGAMLAAVLWNENKATLKSNETTSIREAVAVVRRDPKIMLVGAVQSLFEAAMYIFVLQWPPAMDGAIQKWFGAAVTGRHAAAAVVTPYGTIFSCFMACCLLGSTMFGQLAKMAVPIEHFTVAMLTVATVAMSVATWTVQQSTLSLPLLMGAFFAFEACVGMYFPSIGTLRSRYVPDSHRSVIMNLFGIPLNVLVVSVFLSIQRLGIGGALSISSGALAIATMCMYALRRSVARSNAPPIPDFVI
jgi:MFS transporter, MFS domain-containing protein family, molybdate-anion transporter